MNTSWQCRWLAAGVLAAFVTMGVAAVLPHTHRGRPEASHACAMCQAQTVQPSVAPPLAPRPALQRCAEVVVFPTLTPVPQGLVVLPASRAPPAVA